MGQEKGGRSTNVTDITVNCALIPFTFFFSLYCYRIGKALSAGLPGLQAARNTGTSVMMIEQNYGKFPSGGSSALIDKVKMA
jgi:hypothetical protein